MTSKIKQLEVDGGQVPQCPIAGDANANTICLGPCAVQFSAVTEALFSVLFTVYFYPPMLPQKIFTGVGVGAAPDIRGARHFLTSGSP